MDSIQIPRLFKNAALHCAIGTSYAKARWKLRSVHEEPVVLGVGHYHQELPYVRKLLGILIERGYVRIGLEIPINRKEVIPNYLISGQFFDSLAEFATKKGGQVVLLDMPFKKAKDNADWIARHGVMYFLNAMREYKSDREKTIAVIDASRLRMFDDAMRFTFMNSSSLPYACLPKTEVTITGGEWLLDFAKMAEMRRTHLSAFEYALELAKSGISTIVAKELLAEICCKVNEFMISRIFQEHPELVIVGDVHAKPIHAQLAYPWVYACISRPY